MKNPCTLIRKSLFLVTAALLAGLSGCLAPHNIHFQSYQTVDKKQVELGGSVSFDPILQTLVSSGRAAYGISDAVEFQAIGEYNVNCLFEGGRASKYNFYAGAGTKIQLIESFSVLVKAGVFYDSIDYIFAGDLAFFYGNRPTPKFEFTSMTEIGFHSYYESVPVMIGQQINLGLSSNLDRWSVRPGLGFKIGNVVSGYVGIGGTINL